MIGREGGMNLPDFVAWKLPNAALDGLLQKNIA
jgi:hypothetical protein